MNRESEAEQFMVWLLQQLALIDEEAPSGSLDPSIEASQSLNPLELNNKNELDVETGPNYKGQARRSDVFSFRDTPLSKPGEFSVVQDRFYSLIKRRLRAEIEQKPPLFPWEGELLEYEAEPASVRFWMTQLKQLDVPLKLPDSLLEHLLEQCQSVLQSSLQEGTRLVRAVESLFPNQETSLNNLASLVMAAPARSSEAALVTKDAPLPVDYDAATEAQKMALSLMVAREIIENLTLPVSRTSGAVSREWQTEAGPISLRAESSESGSLRVRGELPCGGRMEFRGLQSEVVAQRPDAGLLGVELFDLAPRQIYPLEVCLALPDEPVLSFQVSLLDEA